ncbi:NAD(+) synthase [Tepidibacillus fermentans]|uniref:NH(3)-dependent NAD(+) synthetase n=1 Tax=Tepidibacillus fermentans TaxID=1281767 RepID=A0A4R3K7E5_9BACI|nr:NAD(+) synthase [Tepidibacillus fermentans]TCS78769.1 NH(3)-dependent NAD(+) synthetase [Tepidibacillus fermentans]
MDLFQEKLRQYKERIQEDISERVNFIRSYVENACAKGVVVGISGGIDSSVTAALCLKALGKERVLGIWMPAYSNPVHEKDANALAEAIDLNLVKIDVGPAFDAILPEIEKIEPLNDLQKGNTKARLRMTSLYAIAGQKGYLVADTCNYSEIYVGYMTKGGDGLADFNPVASLTKHQIRMVAKELGIPESIISKPPSADLWVGQTDEQEMGFTYEDLDRYLLTGEGKPEVIEKIEHLHRISEHKRTLMPGI